MVKKLVILTPSEIEYVYKIALSISDNQYHKHGNFSKGLRKVIEDHKKTNEMEALAFPEKI